MLLLSDCERYGNFPYEKIVEVDELPVSLDNVKIQLKLSGTDEDDFLESLIKTASLFFESFTKQTLITDTYKTYRTVWDIFQLRRCPLQSIESIKYFDTEGVLQTLDSGNYYIVKNNFFGKVAFDESFESPSLRNRPQQIEIEFKVGFGDTTDDIPADIQQGLLEHIAYMYENRGDCIDDACSNIAIPNSTKMAYMKYKIQEIGV